MTHAELKSHLLLRGWKEIDAQRASDTGAAPLFVLPRRYYDEIEYEILFRSGWVQPYIIYFDGVSQLTYRTARGVLVWANKLHEERRVANEIT